MVSLREPIPSSPAVVSASILSAMLIRGVLLLLCCPLFLLFLFGFQPDTLDGILPEHRDGLRHRADFVAPSGADNLDRRVTSGQPVHRRRHRTDRGGNTANDGPADGDAEQSGENQHCQDPTMRRCAECRACIGSPRAPKDVQVDVGLQGVAERGYRLRPLAQEQRNRVIALALRHQSGSGVADLEVALPRRIECVRQALFVARGHERLIIFSRSRVERRLLLNCRAILCALHIGGRQQQGPSVRSQPLADLRQTPEDAGARQVVVPDVLRVAVHGIQPLGGEQAEADSTDQDYCEPSDDLAANAEVCRQVRHSSLHVGGHRCRSMCERGTSWSRQIKEV
jgi:hypothetical protein